VIAKRDYIESVRTKAFVGSLILAPVLFGGSFLGIALLKNKPDIAGRRVAIIDHTGVSAATVIAAVQEKNEHDLIDKDTHRQGMPRYQFEVVAPDDAHPDEQRLALSRRIKPADLYAFVEIGRNALHPPGDKDQTDKNPDDTISWYSNEGGVAEGRSWMARPINDGLRRVRMQQAGVDPARFSDLLANVNVQNMGLVSKDEKTGAIRPAEKRDELTSFMVPFALAMMMVMIVMITAGPMLPALAEDKMQRVHEMLLASATPFELISGKVLAALGRSLTSSIVYIAGALFLLNAMAVMGVAPLELLPWFVVYLIAEVTMLCAIATALGAACSSPQDAQQMAMPLFLPVIIPLVMMTPVMQKPNGGMATVMSFIPPFTPVMMLTRQSMPGGVPAWQPWVGLAGVVVATIAIAWVAARVFRVGILMQGKTPTIGELARWAVKG
jgi:ABC-2 type transport system permease protein